MKLDVNNVIVYLLLTISLGLGAWCLSTANELSVSMKGLTVEVKNLKEQDNGTSALRTSLGKNWERYGEMSKENKNITERLVKLETKFEAVEKKLDR